MAYGFYIKDGLPYYTDGTKGYPCSVAADLIQVKFDAGTTISQSDIKCILTEDEVKHALGIKFVTDWDASENKQKKITNKTVTSIPSEPEEDLETASTVSSAPSVKTKK